MVIALGADPDVRGSVGSGADSTRSEASTEPGASVLRVHLGVLACAGVRLHLSEGDRAPSSGAAITRT